jgi:hypothetical protein
LLGDNKDDITIEIDYLLWGDGPISRIKEIMEIIEGNIYLLIAQGFDGIITSIQCGRMIK